MLGSLRLLRATAPLPPVTAFHYELEFPEVFERENPGFDAVVGNPPFGGHVTVVEANVRGYTDWLRGIHPESTGKCDVVAHFFRRTFSLLRQGGMFGLIATNTIGQGDTRLSGLRWICHHGGKIYRVQRRLKWPGDAAVVVSVVHIAKGTDPGPRELDGREVDRITAFLFHDGGHDDPERLEANAGQCFQGSIVLGMGFTFDDSDRKRRRHSTCRNAPSDRGEPAQPGGNLPLYRRRGDQYEPDPRAPSLRHQFPGLAVAPRRFRRDVAGRGRCHAKRVAA